MRGWPLGAPLLLALLTAPVLVLASSRAEAPVDEYTDRYDDDFRKWSKRYFGPGLDWRWFKAQGVVESTLKPGAVGKSGVGIMQLLPSTYARIKRENPTFGPIHDARWNIAAGIYYSRQNYDIWDDLVKKHMEALRFTLASYNAGPNRIQLAYEKAKKAGKDASRWTMVEKHAPRTTRHYVRKIHQLMGTDVNAPADAEAPAIPSPG